jgi:pimeloyl-ACP methyl ester carboxylesterase
MTLEVTPSYRGGSGTPLVLLHGFTDTWRAWIKLLGALEARHDVFAPTLPGHHGGESLDGELRWPALVDAVERGLDEQGIDRAHVAGNSLGGWLALELALRGRALSVVGLCPAGGWDRDSPLVKSTKAYFTRTARLGGWAADHAEALVSRPGLRKLVLRDVVAHGDRVPAAEAAHMLRGSAGCTARKEIIALIERDHFGDLGPIDVPVRIAWGTEDRLLPPRKAAARLRQLVPQAEFVDLPGLGHLPMWDDPDAVARTILELTGRVDAATPAPVAAR